MNGKQGRPRGARWIAVVAVAALVAAGFALYRGLVSVPDRFNPWAELDVDAPPNFLTGLKLRRAGASAPACFAALGRSGMRYERVPDQVTGPECGFHNALRLRQGREIKLSSPLILSCRAALSFAMWERHGVQPAARKDLQSTIASLEHLGSYACRDINTGEKDGASGRRSRHATADALDVSGFVTIHGRRILVGRDWESGISKSRTGPTAFLSDVHSSACTYFEGVLGPDYNTAHQNHFHLEMGGWRMCD